MKLLLGATLLFTFGWVAYAQTDASPTVKTDCKENITKEQAKKAKKGRAKAVRGETQSSAEAAAEASACPQSPDPAQNATDPASSLAPASTTPPAAPTPTAAISSASVAPPPPPDKSELNVTIYRSNQEESLGAAARRIRAKKAVEEASKAQPQ